MAVAVISEVEVILPVVAVISEVEVILPVVAEHMADVGGTVVIGAATQGEEATDITEGTVVGAGAALASGSDSTMHLCHSITRPFGARTDRLITMLMTIIINGKALQTSMKP
jgi:hypothetical protein